MTPLYVDTLNKSSARQIASDKTQQATTLNYANAVNKIESVPANLKPQIFLNLQSNLRSQPEAGGEQLINQKVTHDSQLTLKTDPVEGFINQWIFKEGISSEQLQKIEQLTNWKVLSTDIAEKLQLPLEKVRSIEQLVNIKTLKQKKQSTARGTAEKQKIILRSVLIDNIGAHTLRNKRKIRYDHTVGLLTEYLTHPELGALIQAISTISCSKASWLDKKRNCCMAKREWFEKHFGKGTNQEQTHIDHDRDKQINNKIEEIINSIFNDEQVSQKALTRICSGHEMTSSNVSLTPDNRASVLPANNRPNETSSKSSRKRPGDSTDNPAQSKRRATNNTEADRQSNNQVQVYSPGLSSNTHAQQTPHPDQQQNIPSDSGSFAESHFIQPVDITNKKVTHGSQLTLKTDPTEGFINQWIFTQGISSEQLQTIEQLTNWKVLSTNIAQKLRLPLEKVRSIEQLVNIKTLKQKKQSTARGTAEKQKIILRSVLIDNIGAHTLRNKRKIRYDHTVGLLTEYLTHPELGALIQAISTISCSKASWLDKKRNCCMAKREWFEKHFGKGTNQEQTHIDHDRDKQINNKIEEIINSIFNDEQVSQKALTRICSGHEMTSSNVSLTPDNRASVLPANNRPNETSSKSSRKRPGDSTDNPAQSKRRATNNTEADRQSNNQVQVYSPGLSSNTHAQQTPHPDQQQKNSF
ncbi:MAG: hypothetical protein OXC48_03595 [Endozoicomonadaceae bacterium]|nr:hypothetical protein [Endozoicomonadaceae bacterium]